MEAIEVKKFLEQSRFPKSQCGEIIHRVLFLVRAPNLQILRIEQGSTPRIDRNFWLRFPLLLLRA
jgi:hypothetical protein